MYEAIDEDKIAKTKKERTANRIYQKIQAATPKHLRLHVGGGWFMDGRCVLPEAFTGLCSYSQTRRDETKVGLRTYGVI